MQQTTTLTQHLTPCSRYIAEEDNNPPKYQYFNGQHFTRDDRTGYYLNSTLHIRMHRYVWEFYNGTIPDGYDIHHKDHDRANNDISNLEAIPSREHASLHCTQMVNVDPERTRKHLASISAKAAEWHHGEQGKMWHKAHYEACKDKLHEVREFTCENCGKTFFSPQTRSRFCSNACKSAWRRKSGFDDVERVCVICGDVFSTNKYSQACTCGKVCRAELKKRRGN